MFGSNQMRMYLAVGVLAIAAVIGFSLWTGRPGPFPGGVPTPSPTLAPTPTPTPTLAPTPTPTPFPTVNPDTATWTSYTSSRYGYSLAYPAGWSAVPATRDWVAESRFEFWGSNGDGADRFINPFKPRNLQEHLTAMSAVVPDGVTETA